MGNLLCVLFPPQLLLLVATCHLGTRSETRTYGFLLWYRLLITRLLSHFLRMDGRSEECFQSEEWEVITSKATSELG